MLSWRGLALRLGSVCAVLCALGSQPGAAQSSTNRSQRDTAIAWACTQEYDNLFHARCVPTVSSHLDASEPSRSLPPPGLPGPRGLPIDARPVASRGAATLLSYEVWRVPLYTLPSAPEFVRELLHIVLCGKTPDCAVSYDPAQTQASLPARARNPFIR